MVVIILYIHIIGQSQFYYRTLFYYFIIVPDILISKSFIYSYV